VLILPYTWIVETADGICFHLDKFKSTNDDSFLISEVDFECSVRVVETRNWRALEILHGMKNRCIEPSLFTEKFDVYSYSMTCYNVLTGKIPFENVAVKDYDVILLQGARPKLPSCLEPWI
jgi:serine/threonine protein kinase